MKYFKMPQLISVRMIKKWVSKTYMYRNNSGLLLDTSGSSEFTSNNPVDNSTSHVDKTEPQVARSTGNLNNTTQTKRTDLV